MWMSHNILQSVIACTQSVLSDKKRKNNPCKENNNNRLTHAWANLSWKVIAQWFYILYILQEEAWLQKDNTDYGTYWMENCKIFWTVYRLRPPPSCSLMRESFNSSLKSKTIQTTPERLLMVNRCWRGLIFCFYDATSFRMFDYLLKTNMLIL